MVQLQRPTASVLRASSYDKSTRKSFALRVDFISVEALQAIRR
ncbi:hypothetical protein JOC76_003801 [Neobacillus cucumis]|nr:hypothetical protein [Neobacillus cucumis]MBM7654317.1 hypothetical protein [Neobacillus cucumis]